MSSVGKKKVFSANRDKGSTVKSGLTSRSWNLEESPLISGHALWEWDIERKLLCFSPEWALISHTKGDAPLEIPYESWWAQVHENDVDEMFQAAQAIIDGKSDSMNVLFRFFRVDGCWGWLLTRGSVTERDEGRAVRVSGILVDVSPLRTDRKFQASGVGVGDEAYHAMLENSPDLIVRMDRELFPLYINPQVKRYMGRDREEYSYSEDLDTLKIDPAQLEFLRENVERVFDEGVTIRKMISFRSAYDTLITGEYAFWPEFDAEGRVASAMTHFRDLTEQVRAEKLARLNEKRLNALYQLTQMDDAPQREVMHFVLKKLIELTGSESGFIFIPDGEFFGPGRMVWSEDHYQFLDELFLPTDSFPPDLKSLLPFIDGKYGFRVMNNGDGVIPLQYSFEGRMKIMRNIIAPCTEGERIVCLAGVCNKATDYKEDDLQQLEMFISGAWLILRRHNFIRELQAAKDAAEQANKAKDAFLANVSHELRTPLNGMLSMLQLLNFMQLTEQQKEYVRTASASGKALLRIISDILDFSRMASGKMTLQCEPFNLKQTLLSSLNLFHRDAGSKGLDFTVKIDPAIPDSLLGDDARFRQIILNVVGNALKFTERGEVAVSCFLTDTDEAEKVRVHLAVADTGIGIPEVMQNVIFEAFTQIDSTSTRKYAGTGLGLGIVKGLVGMMHGSISVDSQVGRGTTIHCMLEFGRTELRAMKKGSPMVALEQESAPLDILIAEDDNVSRFALCAFLNRAGHRSVCVDNGAQALEALQLYPFDCLFTDIQMPGMDGLDLTAKIRSGKALDISPTSEIRALIAETFPVDLEERAIPSDIAIVAVSAHAMSGDKERFLQQGIDHYISKPIIAEELYRVLKELSASIKRRQDFTVRETAGSASDSE